MYNKGHHRNGCQAELAWTPPADYLAEQEVRIQALEAQWQQEDDAARQTVDAAEALAAWEHQPDTTILTNGLWYAVGAYPVIANGREGWDQTSPEELAALLRREVSDGQ